MADCGAYGAGGLRERAALFGLETLADDEALALFLERSHPRGATTWASVLLARWGSLEGVLASDIRSLEAVVGRGAAVDLKLLHETTRRLLAPRVRRRDVISSWNALLAYLRLDLAQRTREQARALFLDKKNQLIADEVMGDGTVDHAPAYPREIIRRALELDASAVILVHNHPSGDPTPSQADTDLTRQVIEAGKSLRISVHDHLVVAREGIASLKALGLI